MNHPDFTQLRCAIDGAITYQDLVSAKTFAEAGLRLAEDKECLGEMMYFKAQRYIIDGRCDEAIPFLEKALLYNPQDGAAYNDLALCRINNGVINGAEALFDKGIAVEPDYATIYHNKGWFLNNLGRSAEALELFRQTLALEPDRAVTYENMADAYEHLGCGREALAAYKKAFDLLPPVLIDIREQIGEEITRLEGKNIK